LSYEQREAVLLRLHGGLRFREIAQAQSISVSTVQGRQSARNPNGRAIPPHRTEGFLRPTRPARLLDRTERGGSKVIDTGFGPERASPSRCSIAL
jgi:transposase